jgi:membrane fusion protein, heavy metal efflux system
MNAVDTLAARARYRRVAIAAVVAAIGAIGVGTATFISSKPDAQPAEAATGRPHADGEDRLAMTQQALAAAGIQLVEVRQGDFASEVAAQATVQTAPGGQAVLTAPVGGSVARITKGLGDPVRAGEVVALVESREAGAIAADRSVAASKADLARKTLAREQRLFEQRVTPRQDLERTQAELAVADAELRRARLAVSAAGVTADGRYVKIVSPIAGRISAAPATLGAFVEPQTELFRIADPSRVQVEASIAATDTVRVVPGDRAVLETGDGRIIGARVRSVTPSLSAETRTATAVLEVAGARLQPGMALRARILPRTAARGGPATIPETAIQSVQGRDVVFVRTPAGFQVRPITVGRRSAGRAEVLSGLSSGEVVAGQNAFLLKADLAKGEGDEH